MVDPVIQRHPLWSRTVSYDPAHVPFDVTVSVNAGDCIDSEAVGSPTNWTYLGTGLSATITNTQ